MDNIDIKEWHVMRATYKRELSAKKILEYLGVESYVPMKYICIEARNNKKIKKLVSAINNLIFVYASRVTIDSLSSKIPYLQYTYDQVERKKSPMVVDDKQMEYFIKITSTPDDKMLFFSAGEIDIAKGTKVRIIDGVFKGLVGYLLRVKGARDRRLVINIDGVVTVATITVPIEMIEVI